MIKGLGVDSIELDRVRRVLGSYGERFLGKIFTDTEREYFERWSDPVPRVAGRFAVKEACMKALGTGWSQGVRWKDIEVRHHPGGKPYVQLHGEARRIQTALDTTTIHCTITHSHDHAIAVVIFE